MNYNHDPGQSHDPEGVYYNMSLEKLEHWEEYSAEFGDPSNNDIPLIGPTNDPFKEYIVDPSEEEESEQILCSFGDVPVMTLGNISTITGKAKSRKTMLASTLVCQWLKPSLYSTVHFSNPEDKSKILWIDTEQSRNHVRKIFARIKHTTGLSNQELNNKLTIMSFRSLSIDQIKSFLLGYLELHISGVGLLIIDGARDLVNSINSEDEATSITRHFLRISQEFNIHLTTIVHQNSSKDSSKVRGHLGSELENKSETVFLVEKQVDYSKVKAMYTRGNTFDDLWIGYNDEGHFTSLSQPHNTNLDTRNPAVHSLTFLHNLANSVLLNNQLSKGALALGIQTFLSSQNINVGLKKISNQWIPDLMEKNILEYSTQRAGGHSRIVLKEAN